MGSHAKDRAGVRGAAKGRRAVKAAIIRLDQPPLRLTPLRAAIARIKFHQSREAAARGDAKDRAPIKGATRAGRTIEIPVPTLHEPGERGTSLAAPTDSGEFV